jgi:hypothetical protein
MQPCGLQQYQFGTKSLERRKVMRSAAKGSALIGGTLAAVSAGARSYIQFPPSGRSKGKRRMRERSTGAVLLAL